MEESTSDGLSSLLAVRSHFRTVVECRGPSHMSLVGRVLLFPRVGALQPDPHSGDCECPL